MNDETLGEEQNKNLDGTAISTPSVEMTAPPVTTAPTYSEEEMRGHVANGTDYTLDQVNAMSNDQYRLYSRIADEASGKKKLADRLALSDRLEKMTKFVADETEGDENYKSVHDEAVRANEFLANEKTTFAKMSDEDAKLYESLVTERYNEASKRRGHLDVAWDALKRGHSSIMNMLVQGLEALKPGEMSQEDADVIKGAQKNANDDELLTPKKVGGIENISSVGDAIDYILETTGENVERMAIGAAGATFGAIAAPAIGVSVTAGAMILGGAATLLGNTGEAVSDQLKENRDDGDIRKSRAYAIAQGIGYSILDGAFGVNKFAGQIWGSLLRRAGLKAAAKGASVAAAKSMYEKATLKGIAKEVGKATLFEGAQEMAQSQGVGRGVRYFQTGSIFRKDENGNYETPGDAFLEAVNEFVGGATAGITFGLLGGASAHVDARRASRISHETNAILKDDKDYQQLPEYAKLLVDRRLQNDRFLATTNLLKPEVLASLEQSNKDIDREIDDLSKTGTEEEKVSAQSAKAYLDIFKSQYSLEEIDNIFGFDNKTGEYLSRDGKRYTSSVDPAAMLNNGEERVYEDGRGAIVYKNRTPGSEVSVGELIGADGKPTGKYMVQNDPHFKTPIEGDGDYIFDSREKAFEAARRLDAYNQWREDRMRSKAELANQVFTKLFGGRGVNLEFVDRPTEHKYINPFTSAAFVPNPKDENGDPMQPTVFFDLGKINNLGNLYTTLVHERSHEDIVEFLMKSKNFYKKVGEKIVPDWQAIEAARLELMAKIQDENGQTAEEVSKKHRNADGTAKTEWGKSAAIAGEEMVAERNSVFELAKQLRDMERGVFGSVEDKIRQAIGLRMAYEMGVDPSAIMPNDVSEEIQKIFDLDYIGEPAPVEFQRETPTWNGQSVDTKATKRGQLRKTVGPQVAQTANGEGEVTLGTVSDEGTLATKPKNLKPQMKAGGGVGYADSANIRRADGATFTKVGTSDGSYAWKNLDTNELVGDEKASEGGYEEIYDEKPSETSEKAPQSAPSEESATTPAPSSKPAEAKETASEAKAPAKVSKISKKTAQVDKETPEKTVPEPTKAENDGETVQNAQTEKPKSAPTTEENPIDYTGWEKNHAKDVVDIIRGLPEGEKKEELKKAAYYGTPDASLKERIGEEKPKKPAPKAKKAKEPEVWTKKPTPKAVSKTETTTPTAEKKSAVAAPTQSDEKAHLSAPKETTTTSRPEAAKPVEAQEARPAAKEEVEPVRVNPDEDTLTIEQGKDKGEAQSVNSEDEVTLGTESDNDDVRRVEESIERLYKDSMSDRQKDTILKLVEKNGDTTLLEKVEGTDIFMVGFGDDADSLFVNKDGNILSEDEIDSLAYGDSEAATVDEDISPMARAKSIFNMHGVLEKDAIQLSDDVVKGIGGIPKSYSSVSDDQLLAMRTQKKDFLALKELWDRWSKDKLPSWLAKNDVRKAYDIEEFRTEAWNRVVAAMDESDRTEENATRLEEYVRNLPKDIRKEAEKEMPAAMTKRSPLGRTVTANAMFYDIFSEMMAEKDTEWYADNEAKRIEFEEEKARRRREEEERKAAEEKRARDARLDRRTAIKERISVNEARARRVALETGVVPETYVKMPEKDLMRLCVPHDGKQADPIAQQEAKNRILYGYELNGEYVNGLTESGVIGELKKRGEWHGVEGGGYEYLSFDFVDKTIKELEKEWTNGAKFPFWLGETENSGLVAHAVGISKNIIERTFNDIQNGKIPESIEAKDERARARGQRNSNESVDYNENEDEFGDEVEFDIAGKTSRDSGTDWYGKAVKAVNSILNTGVLNFRQKRYLETLKDAWRQKVEEAKWSLAAAEALGKRSDSVKNLKVKLRKAYALEFDTDERNREEYDVLRRAAEPLNMKPLVYAAKLNRLLDGIAERFMDKELVRRIRSGLRVSDAEKEQVAKLSRGMFTNDDVIMKLKDIRKDDREFRFNYNDADIMDAMKSNGDEVMAFVVKQAVDGKSDSAIQRMIDNGMADGFRFRDKSLKVGTLLDHAYETYGWIDMRVKDDLNKMRSLQKEVDGLEDRLDDPYLTRKERKDAEDSLAKAKRRIASIKANVYNRVLDLVARMMERNRNMANFDQAILNDYAPIIRGDFKPLTDRVRSWLVASGVIVDNKNKLDDIIVRAIKEKTRPFTQIERRKQGKKLAESDHSVVAEVMAGNGNDEAKTREFLLRSNISKRVDKMIQHYRSVEKDIKEKAEKEAERERRAKENGLLTDTQKKEAVALFSSLGEDYERTTAALKEAGLNENLVDQAVRHIRYATQKSLERREMEARNGSFEQKRDLLIEQLGKTGRDYLVDDKAVAYAYYRLGMSQADARRIISEERKPLPSPVEIREAETMTDAQLSERTSTLGAIPQIGSKDLSIGMDYEAIAEAKDAVAKAEKELADLGKGAPGMFDRVNDRFKLGMSEDEARADLRMEGLSNKRIDTVFEKYEAVKKAREKINAAKETLAKAEERLEKDRGETSMARNKTSGLYTGSAADYAKPSLLKIGTGEGAQAYGWGLYASNRRGIAEWYARADSERKLNTGILPFLSSVIGYGTKKNGVELKRPEGEMARRSYLSDAEYWSDIIAYESPTPNLYLKTAKKYGDKVYDYAQRHVGDYEFKFSKERPEFLYEQTFFTNRAPGDESHLLNWYEPVSEENAKRIIDGLRKDGYVEDVVAGREIKNKSAKVFMRSNGKIDIKPSDPRRGNLYTLNSVNGSDVYNAIVDVVGSPKAASEFLARADIDGIKYPVNSYGKTVKDGDKVGWNYVSFRDDNIRVDHKWVDGMQRYKTLPGANKSTGLSDPSAGFAAEESLEARGFGKREKRPRKVRAVLDRQARDLIAKDPLMLGAVEKKRNGQPLSDVEVAALNLRIAQMQHDAVNGNLDADLFQRNEENMDALADVLRSGTSEAGAALQATQVGVDMRTLDMDVYMRAETKARFRKEIEKESGVGSVGEHDEELRKALDEYKGRIKEMSSELQTAHDEVDKAKEELAKVHAKAEDDAVESYRRGLKKGRAEAENKLIEDTKSFAKAFSGKIVEGEAQFAIGALGILKGKYGVNVRHAGNPKVSDMDEDTKEAMSVIYHAAKNDIEVAKEIIRYDKDLSEHADEIIAQLEAFVESEKKKARTPDGTVKGKRRAADENIGKRAEKARRKMSDRRKEFKTYLDRIQKRAEDAYTRAVMSDTEEQAMRATGEYAREMFRVLSYSNPDRQTDELLDVLVSKMNELYGRFSKGEENERFDAQDAKDALLGKGSFAPVTKESAKVDLARLLKAQKLLDENKETESAKEAGIRGVTDADILQELDRRIGSLLNTKLNRLEERIEAKDEDTAGLRKEIHDLIMALHDIRSGKPVGELLDRYLNLAIGMKDYRKQRTLREQIESRIAMYERKLKENDFESVQKVPVPDDRDELLKVADAQRHLEQKRERFKRERSMWRVRKGPFMSRVVGSIIELLGEVKAVAGSMDLSAVLRQGGQMTFAHPIMAYRSFRKTLKAFGSESKANDIMDEIAHRPNYQYYLEAGIDFTDWGDNAASAEDMYILNKYRLITRNRLMKWGINASERAFVTYLNLMRANVFDAMVACSPMREAANCSKEQLLAIGRFVNIASQRGDIDQSGKLGKALELANGVLWSPRNLISRFQFIWNTIKLAMPGTKYYGISGDMAMRKAFAKETARYVTGVAVTVFFAKMMADLLRDDDEPPVDIVTDPKSSDFLKVKVGNTRLDFLSGLQQVMVFGSRMWAGEKTQGNGNTVKKDRGEILARFARTKFSPAASVIYDIFTREDFDRRDISFNPSEQLTKDKDTIGVTRYLARSLFAPLIVGDVLEQAEDSIGRLPATFVLSALGASVMTYDSGTYKVMKQDYQYFKRLWKAAESDEERKRLEIYHPMLRNMGALEQWIKSVSSLERNLKKLEKAGAKPSDLKTMKDEIERRKKIVINLMTRQKNPTQVD